MKQLVLINMSLQNFFAKKGQIIVPRPDAGLDVKKILVDLTATASSKPLRPMWIEKAKKKLCIL